MPNTLDIGKLQEIQENQVEKFNQTQNETYYDMRANSAVTTHFVGNILVESCKYANCFTTTQIPIPIPTTTTSTSTPSNTIPSPTTPTFTASGTSATTTSLLATISSHILSSTNSLTTTLTTFNDAINNSNTIPTTTGETAVPNVPAYIRNTAMLLCITIMVLGIVGNVMVPIVIIKTKDMRNSTNIFLTNLSIADLLVLLICTPTVLVEVNTRPETWILGHELCKAVPFIELTVAHASVLTILAISFERYYAICEPLKAGYVCTKARAMLICMLAWGIAALFTSPIIFIATYRKERYYDGSEVAVCFTSADTFWSSFYFIASITIFFGLPFIVLVVLYAAIARKLLHRSAAFQRPLSPVVTATNLPEACKLPVNQRHFIQHQHQQSNGMRKNRKQVIYMLVTVVASFFLCLLPFRAFTLWVISGSASDLAALGVEGYYNLLYFCRFMLYLNSALNPILYNIMSSKFRSGFWRLIVACCPGKSKQMRRTHRSIRTHEVNVLPKRSTRILKRHSTFINSTTSTSSSAEQTSYRSSSTTGSTHTCSKGTFRSSLQSDGSADIMLEHKSTKAPVSHKTQDIQAITTLTS